MERGFGTAVAPPILSDLPGNAGNAGECRERSERLEKQHNYCVFDVFRSKVAKNLTITTVFGVSGSKVAKNLIITVVFF